MESFQLESQVIEGCRRLARKGFLNSPEDSFSIRIPGEAKILLATGLEHWAEIGGADLYTLPLLSGDVLTGIHAAIYEERGDAGAVAICSPQGARMLARHGGILPPLFDEQARHIGRSMGPLPDEERVQTDLLTKTLRRGVNAVLLGERLLCLGMTCERALFNVELYEKCARAYVIARSAGSTNSIPWWVRFIANRRLFRNQADAAASYRTGRMPEGVSAY